MYDKKCFFNSFPFDGIVTTGAVLLTTRLLDNGRILGKNSEIYSAKSLFYGFVYATTLKSLNKYFLSENFNNLLEFSDFSIDTIVILPLVVNLWKPQDNAISQGVYLAAVLAVVPSYMSKISLDTANYIANQKEIDPALSCNFSDKSSYTYTTFNGVIPAFTRGVVFFNLKNIVGNEVISALISGGVMGFMLDESKEYTTLGINVSISSLNAAANKLPYLKFNTILDRFYPDSSVMVAIEFAEYFLRTAQIDKILHETIYNNQNFTTTALINESDSSNIKDEL